MGKLERIGISVDDELLKEFDSMIKNEGYLNRSEAIRDLIRRKLSEKELVQPNSQAVGGVFLIYDHHSSKLTEQMIQLQHSHILKVITSMHVHLDHHHCLEVIVLKGKVKEIQSIGTKLGSLKGVKLSRINLFTSFM